MFYDPDIVTPEMAEEFIKRMHEENAILAFDSTLLAIQNDTKKLRQRLSKISNPALIIWGRNDRIIPYQDQLIEYLKISDVDLKIIDVCGHVPFIEIPSTFIEIVIEFLLDK
ncbi:MAG: alpha/beta hydrolase [Nitrososphaeraceae archaeon]|nr:alpha/beta hydrolase [Nitrososphaeraceae archaeon]